jgi:hypothetical protein
VERDPDIASPASASSGRMVPAPPAGSANAAALRAMATT